MNRKKRSFEPLQPLDLGKCPTVDSIVQGMSKCSFGARMLGEATSTIEQMIRQSNPVLIYDGKSDTPLATLLKEMVEKRWFSGVKLPEEYAKKRGSKNIIVVGGYSERHEEALYKKSERAVFINSFELAKPGQIRDGYFPDAVFNDPRFIMPLISASLDERLEGKKTTINQFMGRLEKYRGLAESVARGAQTLSAMVNNPECTVFLTISGAMTIAQMGLVICDMIDSDMVDYISTTGALIAHGLIEGVGLKHYKHDPQYDDAFLAKHKINRVTDTLEPETNFTHIVKVMDHVLEGFSGKTSISPTLLHKKIGEYVAKTFPQERGMLKSAYEKEIPVFAPAFFDSEIGNDLYTHNQLRSRQGKPKIRIDMEKDSASLIEMMTHAKRAGIFTIGGGVPRNNTQNVAPLIEIMNDRLGTRLPENQFFYGLRISPDRMHTGHLSGCTYDENKSWRKMDVHGRFSEIKSDATQIWPFLVKYVMEKKEPSA